MLCLCGASIACGRLWYVYMCVRVYVCEWMRVCVGASMFGVCVVCVLCEYVCACMIGARVCFFNVFA